MFPPGRPSCPGLGHSPQPLGKQVSISTQNCFDLTFFWLSYCRRGETLLERQLKAKDQRIKLMSEILAGIKVEFCWMKRRDFLMSFFNQGFEALCMGDAFYERNRRDPRQGDQSPPLDCQAVGSCQLHLLLRTIPHDTRHFPHLHIQVISQGFPRLQNWDDRICEQDLSATQ